MSTPGRRGRGGRGGRGGRRGGGGGGRGQPFALPPPQNLNLVGRNLAPLQGDLRSLRNAGSNSARQASAYRTRIFRTLGIDRLGSHTGFLSNQVRQKAGEFVRSVYDSNVSGIRDVSSFLSGAGADPRFVVPVEVNPVAAIWAARERSLALGDVGAPHYTITIRGNHLGAAHEPFEITRTLNPNFTRSGLMLMGNLLGLNEGEIESSNPYEVMGSDPDVMTREKIDPSSVQIEFNRFPAESGNSRQPQSGGSFFKYWVDERFPEDLSHLQVYKRSQLKTLISKMEKGEEIELENYEVDCFGNCLIFFRIPLEKILKYFEMTAHIPTPWIPTNQIKKIASDLSLNVSIAYYSSTQRTRGDKVKKHMYGGNDPILRIARIESHYVPDVDSGWTKWAIRNYLRVKELFGNKHPVEKVKMGRAVEKRSDGSFRFRVHDDRSLASTQYSVASYGEMLAVLIYGIDKERTPSGNKRTRRIEESNRTLYEQEPMIKPMTADEHMLRTCLYTYFRESLKERKLPMELGIEKIEEMIKEYSEPVRSSPQVFLNVPPMRLVSDSFLGKATYIPGSFHVKNDVMHSYEYFEKKYRESGTYESAPYDLKDKMTKEIRVITSREPLVVQRFSVKCEYTLVTFDFETTTDGIIHEAYMCSLAYYETSNGEPFSYRNLRVIYEEIPEDHEGVRICKRSFYGKKCGQQMVDYVLQKFKTLMVLMVAHNMRYDLNQLMATSKCTITNGIFKSVNRTNCADVTYVHSMPELFSSRSIYHLDSLPIVSMSLERLATTFGLSCEKEIMPYGYYDSKLICRMFPHENETVPREPFDEIFNAAKHLLPHQKHEEFLEALEKSGAKVPGKEGYFSPMVYAKYYCERDCEILLKGFTLNRKLTAGIKYFSKDRPDGTESMLDCFNAVSASQIASHLMKKADCFEGTYDLSGTVRDYVASSIVGGRTMVRANLPHAHIGIVEDFDACGLYMSAMHRIAKEHGGFPKGLPKVWKSEVDLNDPKIVYYVVTVKISKVTTNLMFPVISYLDYQGGRHFSNVIVGKTITMDKITWEDAQKFQGIQGEIICGVYFDQGGNDGIGKMVSYLYEERKKLKKAGHDALQNLIKLLLNSCYGRMIMKPIECEMVFLSGEAKINAYVYKHSVSIRKVSRVRKDFAIVERFHSLYKHKSQPHMGSFVLSVSKRIMNEVMCLAEKIGAPIHYQDTDSMHIEKWAIPMLGKKFFEEYGRPLIAAPGKNGELEDYESGEENFGLFHGDFDKVPGYENPVSVRSVYCGKKMYMDELRMVHSTDRKAPALYKNHLRMKGVPSDAIEAYVEEIRRSNPNFTLFDFYCGILNGKKHKIDLTKSKKSFFASTKEMTTSTRRDFSREIGLLQHQKERALKEAALSGFLTEVSEEGEEDSSPMEI